MDRAAPRGVLGSQLRPISGSERLPRLSSCTASGSGRRDDAVVACRVLAGPDLLIASTGVLSRGSRDVRIVILLAGVLAPLSLPVAFASNLDAAADANAHSEATPAAAIVDLGETIEEVTVTGQRLNLIGTAQTASEGVVVQEELQLVPAYRPAEVLETVPGLDVTLHSGEGKAAQYLMRGYNLDHGTDLALFVDDMPVNEPSHAHGQGYADLNFVIPQLATNVTYTKGTYYADEGDFSSVGSVHINCLDVIPDQAAATVGSLGFANAFSAGASRTGEGNLLGAVGAQRYDGPWTTPGDQRELDAVLRFSTGSEQHGYSITGMFYHDTWKAQTDQPERALSDGLLSSRWETLDPSDAGYAQRVSLSWVFRDTLGDGRFSANVYVISNHLTLWNDFTHFLVDAINGDQEQQHEDRLTIGSDTSYAWTARYFAVDHDWLAGWHGRYDFNDVSRLPTEDRVPLTGGQLAAADYPSVYSEHDQIRLSAIAGYGQLTSHWADWFRSVVGLREDYQYGNDAGTWYGTASKSLAEPKVSVIFRTARDTELYASWGIGYHSDDLRGVNQARIEGATGAPLIARQTGEELGWRQQLLDQRVVLTLAAYALAAQSETTYNPDIGQDTAGPSSHRRGFEVNVTYQASRWLEFYGSYSGNHARYTTPFDDGTGHLGYDLPNAPFATGSFNVYVHDFGPWSGGLMYRYLSSFPLSSGPCVNSAVQTDFPGLTSCASAPTPKGQVLGSGYGEWNSDVHYALPRGWSVAASVYNIFNKKADQMQYWYVDRLPGEPSYGEADIHFHPLEPLTVRLTIAKQF